MALSITAANVTAITKHAKPRIISGIVDNQQAISTAASIRRCASAISWRNSRMRARTSR